MALTSTIPDGKRLLYTLTAAALVSLAMGWLIQSPSPERLSPPSQKEWRSPPGKTPAPRQGVAASRSGPQVLNSAALPESEPPIQPDPSRVRKHIAVQQFLNSPARDTSACREMLSRLLEHGYGIEHLKPVYLAAWEVRKWDPAYAAVYVGSPTGQKLVAPDDPEHRERLADLREKTKLRMMDELRHGVHGAIIDDPELLNEILDIRPKVFYGQSYGAMSSTDARLLDDQEVVNYLRIQPVKDPVESQKRYAYDPETVAELERQL
jgi:hypothetical protein